MDANIFKAIVSGGTGIVLTLNASDLREVITGIVHDERRRISEELERHREEPTLTRKDVQKLLGVSETTLITWAKDDYLVPVRIGRKVMYRPSDIDDILHKQ